MEKREAHLSIVFFVLFLVAGKTDAVECFVGSEAAVATTDLHYRQCNYACGIYERLFDETTQLYDLNEFYFDCLPKSFDPHGICLNTEDRPSILRDQSSMEELTTLAPEIFWDDAWKVAQGPIGKVMCCNLPDKKGKANGCEPISFYRRPPKCLAWYDRANKHHIWRVSTKEKITASCEAVMFFRNGRVYRRNGPNSFGMLCPDGEDHHCRVISNADYVENVLGKTLYDEDRRLHPSDSAILCCANTYRGTEYAVPDDPYTRIECKLEGSDEIVGYQQGAKCDKVKPFKRYNEHAEFEENIKRIKDEL